MQVVILAAGKSTRTYPLTLTRPKPLLKVMNKTILEHNLDQLKEIVDEVIIVIGFKKEMIVDYLKNKKYEFKIKFVEQKEQLGSAHAVIQASTLLKHNFIVMNGDDLYSKEDIKECIRHEYCVLGQKVRDYSKFGIFKVKDNFVLEIVEKPKKFISDIANTGLYVLNKKVFEIKLKKTERNEYEITDYIKKLNKDKKINFELVKDYWFPIVYPWDLLNANEFFINKIRKSKIKGLIEKNVVIKGNIIIGSGTIVKSGTYIEGNVVIGKNCEIGPNSYLRNGATIENNCKIGPSVEIKNSIIMNNSKVPHLSYIGDSIIGENCNLGCGTVTANLRHDSANVKSMIKGKLVDSKRRKLGSIIGDDVHTGINTSIYPGRKIWPNKTTSPGEVVKKDID
jgi:bifunctional UDP-N-acetylglucosamine pyrophosphorylase/glucosamine-1-phosphate N-acetyltransferase